ncbi:MAG: UDP-galactopyranose mutase [Muribaculaceae bacterium]|nr:UDP-galactopyranose mutase [Muribaculaceae bacterium]
MTYDYLIVGAGLFGSTFAYLAGKAGKRCLVIDRRPHVGGNLFCERVADIDVHKYGAHIFHSSNPEVIHLVTEITPFNRFTNSPIAVAPDGRLYNLPFNLNTFYQLWGVTTPSEAESELNRQRSEAVANMQRQGISAPRNLEEQALALVGRDIYETLIKGYTQKQWGRPCTQLPAFIIKRLPVRLTFDNNYFSDAFQGIPTGGYNPMIERMLAKADVELSTDFFSCRTSLTARARKVVFTGQIDQFFDYRFGHLHYRSLQFETETLPTSNFQGNAVVNYTSASIPFTRIIEHKHFAAFGQDVYLNPSTVITREFPLEWAPGLEPFYPVNDTENQARYERYAALAACEPDTIFGGRLATYSYLDMGPTIALAIASFKADKH